MAAYDYTRPNNRKYDKGLYCSLTQPDTSWNRLSLSTPPNNSDLLISPRSHVAPMCSEKSGPTNYDYGGGGDIERDLRLRQRSCHRLAKDHYTVESERPDIHLLRVSSNEDKYQREKLEEEEKKEKLYFTKRSTCKFCDTTNKNGTCQCPIHLPTVHSRYLRSSEDRSRNSVAINVFRNGENRVAPILIQIPKRRMHSMEEVMKYIDQLIKFSVGYAHSIYTKGGDIIYEPNELKPYEVYIVANNIKRQFIHLDYGNKKPETMWVQRRRRFCPDTFSVSLAHYYR